MSKVKGLLKLERNMSMGMYLAFWAAVLSGALGLVIPFSFIWQQWNSLFHLLSGLTFSFVALPFFYTHFKRTIGIRRISLLITGILLFFIFSILVASGYHLAIYGVSEVTHWIVDVHIGSGLIIVITLLLHVIFHFIFYPNNRKLSPESKFPSISSHFGRNVFYLTIVSQLTLLTLVFLSPDDSVPIPQPAMVDNYSQEYGPHPFRPSLTETSHGGFVKYDEIANSAKCISCHKDIGMQWMSSIHKQAASDPTYVTNITLLVQNKGIAASRYCEGCHAPAALLTGELSDGGLHGGIEGTTANMEGVTCMSCHGVKTLASIKGVASYTFSPGVRYLFEDSGNATLESLANLLLSINPEQHKKNVGHSLLKDPKFCASCHTQFMDIDMNNWGWFRMQNEYGAWAESPYSHQGDLQFSDTERVRCQDCHMPLVKADDPSANADGMVRSHLFLGANTFVPKLSGDTAHFEATKTFLQKNKVRLHIDPPQRDDSQQTNLYLEEGLRGTEESPVYFYLGEKAMLQVVVSNQGVGHNFPGGTIDINEVWVEFSVKDATGSLVYQSGWLDEANNVDEEAHFYRSIPIDRYGNHVWRHDLFNMVGHSFKRVIKAGESDVINYAFDIPAWIKSPLTVSSRVRYRKLNNKYAKWALKESYFDLPIVDVAYDSLEIPVYIRKSAK